MIPQQAVLLAGGTGSRLYPLNSTGTPKALLPVGNELLISFPLKSLEEAGIKDVFIICFGEGSASKLHNWAQKHYTGGLQLTVKSIPEGSQGSHTAGALKAVASKLTGKTFFVVSGDLVTDIPLKAILAQHYVTSATCTSLFTRRKTSPSAETKPGKAPTNVDYVAVGLAEGSQQLLFFDSSNEVAKRSIRVAPSALAQDCSLSIQTDLVDQHCYVFDRQAVFQALDSKPTIAAIKEDLVPYLVRHQAKSHSRSRSPERNADTDRAGKLEIGAMMASNRRPGWWTGAFIAPTTNYCRRANTLAAYADVNKELTSPELATTFLTAKPNAEGYFRHETVAVAPKTTIAPGSMLGKGSKVGEKCTVKRSVIGTGCTIGNHVKLLNSVLMDRVVVDEGCVVQNCILCSGSHLQGHCQLRDCQVGPDYRIAGHAEHRGEIFDKNKGAPH